MKKLLLFACMVENIQFDTIYMKVDGVNGDYIGADNAVEAYNALKENVRELYSGIDAENKKLHYVMVDDYSENASKDGGKEVEIVVMTGEETERKDPPFTTTPWYGVPFVGEGYFGPAVDAANYLENAIADCIRSRSPLSLPYPNMYYVIFDLQMHERYTGNIYDWVYKGDPDSLLTYNDMNRLYADYMENAHSEDMRVGSCGEYVYVETTIDNSYYGRKLMTHDMKIWYGTCEWRIGKPIYPEPDEDYPIEIDPAN